ncbi:MAG: hypothetical protein ABEH65_04190 [Halobacteriales archaeon]
MQSAQVVFEVADPAAERSFLRTYLTSAWDRLYAHESFDRGWFWRFGTTAQHGSIELEGGTTVEDGGIILVLNGDPTPEPVIEAERPRWSELKATGAIDDWAVTWFHPEYENAREKAIQQFGAVGGDRTYRLRPLAAELTLLVIEEFDERLPAVGSVSDDNPVPVGYWTVIHYLMKQQGYDWYDEIEACRQAIENRIRSLASFHGDTTAEEAVTSVIEELEAIELDG